MNPLHTLLSFVFKVCLHVCQGLPGSLSMLHLAIGFLPKFSVVETKTADDWKAAGLGISIWTVGPTGKLLCDPLRCIRNSLDHLAVFGFCTCIQHQHWYSLKIVQIMAIRIVTVGSRAGWHGRFRRACCLLFMVSFGVMNMQTSH